MLTFSLLFGSSIWSYSKLEEKETSIKVPLTRKENVKAWSGFGVSFDEDKINKSLEEKPIKNITEYKNKYTIGLANDGTYILFRKKENEDLYELLVDTNRNNDFSDETVSILKPEGNVVIKILRTYEHSGDVWLPYFIAHGKRKGEDRLSMMSHYRAEGMIDIADKNILIVLWDMNINGKFDDDYRHGTNFGIDLDGDGSIKGRNEYYHSSELIPIEKDFYEVSEITKEGSSITFIKSELKQVKVGESAPDFELRDNQGNKYRISDLKGNVVVMNFWASWCKPCIEKFPEIRKLYEKYDKESFKFIGINTDSASRMKEAQELIDEYDFAWPQVMLGNPDFSPLWRSYSRVSEHASSISLIVVIDKSGIVRYAYDASKTLEEIKSILEKLK